MRSFCRICMERRGQSQVAATHSQARVGAVWRCKAQDLAGGRPSLSYCVPATEVLSGPLCRCDLSSPQGLALLPTQGVAALESTMTLGGSGSTDPLTQPPSVTLGSF